MKKESRARAGGGTLNESVMYHHIHSNIERFSFNLLLEMPLSDLKIRKRGFASTSILGAMHAYSSCRCQGSKKKTCRTIGGSILPYR